MVENKPAMPVPQNLWDEALKSLPEDEKNKLNVAQVDEHDILQQVLVVAEQRKEKCLGNQWKITKLDGSEIVVRNELEKVVTWVNKFKEVGDVAANYDPAHAALPWAAVRLILQTTINDVEIFCGMVEGIEKVTELLARCAVYKESYLNLPPSKAVDLLAKAMIRLYASILSYLAWAIHYFGSSSKKRILKSLLSSKESKIDPAWRKIIEHKSEVLECILLVHGDASRSLALATQNTIQRVGDGVEEVRKDLSTFAAQDNVSRFLTSLQGPFDSLHDRFDNIEHDLEFLSQDLSDQEIARRKMAIFWWLSKVNYPKHHESALDGLLQGSAYWFLNKPKYADWENFSKPSILWLHGIPGSGKTKIIATVVERLIKSRSASDNTMLAYFYCSRNTDEKERAEPDFILRSILKQLCYTKLQSTISKDVVSAYVAKYKDAEKIGCDPLPLSLDESTDLIVKLSNTRPAIIVLDALDECNNERRLKLMVALDRIIQKSKKPVRIIVSSRDDDDIVCKLENAPNVYISSIDNQDDIARFIDQELERSIKERSLLRGNVTEILRLRIKDTLLHGAQGMFRWVSMCIQNLERAKHEQSLINILGKLPQDLAKLYALAYQQIIESHPQDREIADKVFMWLLCSQRIMTDKELIAALAMDLHGNRYPLTHAELLNMCCNFVIFNKEEKAFRFAHLSVREYFEGQAEFAEQYVNSSALARCIQVYAPLSNSTLDIMEDYANTYWISHYAKSGNLPHEGDLGTLFRLFLTERFDRWKPYRENEKVSASIPADVFYPSSQKSTLQPIYDKVLPGLACIPSSLISIACVLKDTRILSLALTRTSRGKPKAFGVNKTNRFGHSLLHYAVGHTYLAFSGLSSGGSPTAMCKPRLQMDAAMEEIDAMFFRALVDSGAHIDASDSDGRTPLHWAALGNYESMFSLLINKGANIHAVTKSHSTALHYAARNGSTDMVETLLAAGADVHVVDLAQKTPLIWAKNAGHVRIEDLLENCGAKREMDKRITDDLRTHMGSYESDSTPDARLANGPPSSAASMDLSQIQFSYNFGEGSDY